jgi:hypothetical protein
MHSPEYEQRPNTTAIDAALGEIREYNLRNTGLSGVFRGVFETLVAQNDHDHLDLTVNTDEQSAVAGLNREMTVYDSRPVIQSVGLDFDDRKDESAETNQKLSIGISDVVMYEDFLNKVEDAGDYSNLSYTINQIWNSLNASVRYSALNGEEDNAALLASLVIRLLPAHLKLQEAGLETLDTEQGLEVASWSQRAEFSDYFTSQEIMGKPGYFDMSMWHLDLNPESFFERWEDVFDNYRRVREKYGHSSPLTALIELRISDALDALDNASKVFDEKGYPDHYKEKLLPAIDRVHDKALDFLAGDS